MAWKDKEKERIYRAYYKKNIERIRGQKRVSPRKARAMFPDKYRERQRLYRLKYKDIKPYFCSGSRRAYYIKNKDKLKSKRLLYVEKNRARINAQRRFYRKKYYEKRRAYYLANKDKNKEALALGRMMLAAQSMEAIIQNKAV